jgi:hypothetical protein
MRSGASPVLATLPFGYPDSRRGRTGPGEPRDHKATGRQRRVQDSGGQGVRLGSTEKARFSTVSRAAGFAEAGDPARVLVACPACTAWSGGTTLGSTAAPAVTRFPGPVRDAITTVLPLPRTVSGAGHTFSHAPPCNPCRSICREGGT